MKNSWILVVSFIFFVGSLCSQVDSMFRFQDYISLVIKYHPEALNANLSIREAHFQHMKAKGNFDPKLQFDQATKRFDNKNYYSLSNTVVKLPTWFGLEFKGGYEANSGLYLSEEHVVPGSGLWYGGVSMPIGRNLFFDERRAILRKAQINNVQAENMQKMNLAELSLEASEIYWNWYKAVLTEQIAQEGIRLAQERLVNVKSTAQLGDIPFIDTLEATILLNNRQLEYQNYVLQTINYRNKLNTFLWADEHIPLELASSATPDTTYKVASLVVDKIDSLQSIWMNEYHLKRRAIEIDRKLYAEYLKPEIDVNYNPLLIPQANNFLPVFNPVNYKFGINASYSLLLRKERANFNLAKVKLEGTENSTALKFQELEMKLSTVIQTLSNLSDQIVMQERMVSYYKTITSAELTKYQIGESTQFVVNSREMKYLESKMKLVDLKAKYYGVYAQYIYLTQ